MQTTPTEVIFTSEFLLVSQSSPAFSHHCYNAGSQVLPSNNLNLKKSNTAVGRVVSRDFLVLSNNERVVSVLKMYTRA